MDKNQLIKQILADDQTAFCDMMRTYGERLYRIIYRMVMDSHYAEDILQETFVAAHLNMKKFRQDSSLFTWLSAIAYNKALTHVKHKRLNKWLSLDVTAFVVNSAPAGQAEKKELKQVLENAMLKLPVDLRMVITLYEIEHLDHKTIAEIMDCPIGTVWSDLSRAKAELRKLLKDFSYE
ncbi:MAG: sigma-70 family RNA polymerase sigma factor [Planctomycetes bacterium]|nr:sigma-70 family RNA polymerase sigma factor [Planctomycetota bacterium]